LGVEDWGRRQDSVRAGLGGAAKWEREPFLPRGDAELGLPLNDDPAAGLPDVLIGDPIKGPEDSRCCAAEGNVQWKLAHAADDGRRQEARKACQVGSQKGQLVRDKVRVRATGRQEVH
jgi:hypothetical protein